MGAQDKFSWTQVGLSAIGAGVSAGLAGWAPLGGEASAVGNVVVRSAVVNASTQGIGVVTGLQAHFDWRGVAASAFGAGAGRAAGVELGRAWSGTAIGDFAARALTGIVSGTVTGVMHGGTVAIQQVAVDAFGNALGESLADASSAAPTAQSRDLLSDFIASNNWANVPVEATDGRLNGLTFSETAARQRVLNNPMVLPTMVPHMPDDTGVVRDFDPEGMWDQPQPVGQTGAPTAQLIMPPTPALTGGGLAAGGYRPIRPYGAGGPPGYDPRTDLPAGAPGSHQADPTLAGGTPGKFMLDPPGIDWSLTPPAVQLVKRIADLLTYMVPGTSAERGGGVDLEVKYKEGWTAAQRAEADAKVKFLTGAPTIVTSSDRSGTAAATNRYKRSEDVPRGTDVDHMQDLQLGGSKEMDNLWKLDSSVNRSLGAQIQQQIKNLPIGTLINKITIKD
jgi:hypothetical protein